MLEFSSTVLPAPSYTNQVWPIFNVCQFCRRSTFVIPNDKIRYE